MKPSTTLMVFIHEPDFGALFSQLGNMAKRANGMANANANPSMPTVGAIQLPEVTVSTSSSPMIGAVQENETRTNVNAIRKMEIMPVVFEAFESTEFDQLSGSLISNHPKKENANTTNSRKRKMLNTALVESSLSLLGPKMAVTSIPTPR